MEGYPKNTATQKGEAVLHAGQVWRSSALGQRTVLYIPHYVDDSDKEGNQSHWQGDLLVFGQSFRGQITSQWVQENFQRVDLGTCYRCNGTGKTKAFPPLDNEPRGDPRKCGACNGTGRLPEVFGNEESHD